MDTSHSGKKIILTNHAVERGEQAGLNFNKLLAISYHARPVRLPLGMEAYKGLKYGLANSGVFYMRNKNLLLTCVIDKHRQTGEDIVLILTVTDTKKNPGKWRGRYQLTRNGKH